MYPTRNADFVVEITLSNPSPSDTNTYLILQIEDTKRKKNNHTET
jgi:hypothetical protein